MPAISFNKMSQSPLCVALPFILCPAAPLLATGGRAAQGSLPSRPRTRLAWTRNTCPSWLSWGRPPSPLLGGGTPALRVAGALGHQDPAATSHPRYTHTHTQMLPPMDPLCAFISYAVVRRISRVFKTLLVNQQEIQISSADQSSPSTCQSMELSIFFYD